MGQQLTVGAERAGVAWIDVEVQVRHVLHLLETQGERALEVVRGILKLVRLATARDLVGVFEQLNATVVDVQLLVAAVKAEFGLE